LKSSQCVSHPRTEMTKMGESLLTRFPRSSLCFR
jgi:hypothetical protein